MADSEGGSRTLDAALSRDENNKGQDFSWPLLFIDVQVRLKPDTTYGER
jgi:hypothetical protein